MIATHRLVYETSDCGLVPAGVDTADDRTCVHVLARVEEETAGASDLHVLVLPPDSQIELRVLQRAATVVLQKSLREAFGLSAAEAQWKGKAVGGSATGGILLHVLDGVNGYLAYSVELAAFCQRFLLNPPVIGVAMGWRCVEMVRQNFLLPRHLRDHLILMLMLRALWQRSMEL